ncbi:hypothetical protein CASFOL_041073 [Castilleja foliolosa]|uniref:Uncharacterized protein n=1 Tax=Castilleja foliolosa TaxID=1961234 RepID=A0ABD3BDR4_9LAMI
MSRNRILLCTLLVLLSIIVSISANRSVDQLIEDIKEIKRRRNISKLKYDSTDKVNRSRDFVLRCFRLFERYRRAPFDKYDSWEDEMDHNVCFTASKVWLSVYENTGRDLLIWHNNNQTMVDIDICELDLNRCPEELRQLVFSF